MHAQERIHQLVYHTVLYIIYLITYFSQETRILVDLHVPLRGSFTTLQAYKNSWTHIKSGIDFLNFYMQVNADRIHELVHCVSRDFTV